MSKIPPGVREKLRTMERCTDPNKRECDILNATPGKLTGCDCPTCKNKGVIYRVDGDYIVSHDCECMEVRRSVWNIEKSGLAPLLKQCTFENFIAKEPWQQDLKAGAIQFLSDHSGKWFYAGGQVGCGKTHICTAICGGFLEQRVPVRYMLWRDEIVKIKAVVNDAEQYQKLVTPLKTAPVLYVDDFFKTADELDGLGNLSRKRPTTADTQIAFEIMNYRYIHQELVTIISSERSIEDLLDCDQATGSRIYQRTKDYCFYFRPDTAKNYRLR